LSFLSIRAGVIRRTSRKPRNGSYVVALPIQSGSSPALGIFTPVGTKTCVNGITAPRVAVLREKDEMMICSAPNAAFVTLYTGNQVGRIDRNKIGSKCPVCCQAFSEDDYVYVCLCGFALHAQNPEVDAQSPGCADMLTKCLDCYRSIEQSSTNSFSYVPGGW